MPKRKLLLLLVLASCLAGQWHLDKVAYGGDEDKDNEVCVCACVWRGHVRVCICWGVVCACLCTYRCCAHQQVDLYKRRRTSHDHFASLNGREYRAKFRVTKRVFNVILNKIQHRLKHRSITQPPAMQLAIFLNHCAHGNAHRVLQIDYGLTARKLPLSAKCPLSLSGSSQCPYSIHLWFISRRRPQLASRPGFSLSILVTLRSLVFSLRVCPPPLTVSHVMILLTD
jgi:hypothetical protein